MFTAHSTLPPTSLQDPHYEDCTSNMWAVIALLLRRRCHIHLYNNDDFFGSMHTQTLLLKGSTLSTSVSCGSWIFLNALDMLKVCLMSSVLHLLPANALLPGRADTFSDIHDTVTEYHPSDLTSKILLISLCLHFPFCNMSTIVQAIFQINV